MGGGFVGLQISKNNVSICHTQRYTMSVIHTPTTISPLAVWGSWIVGFGHRHTPNRREPLRGFVPDSPRQTYH